MRPQNWLKFSFGKWLANAAPRMHRNKLAAALANKLARIAWSVLSTGKAFDTHKLGDRGGVAFDLHTRSRLKECMERIDRRALSLVAQMAVQQPVR